MSATIDADERYTIISADCHAGANHETYRQYLDPAYLEDFDAWRNKYKNPFRDLQDGGRVRNWDNERRISDLERDGGERHCQPLGGRRHIGESTDLGPLDAALIEQIVTEFRVLRAERGVDGDQLGGNSGQLPVVATQHCDLLGDGLIEGAGRV